MAFNYLFLFLLASSSSFSTLVTSQTIVKTLPGYPAPLPFKLETGYIGVGDDEVVQLFYYFVESEGNPKEDPLIIYLDGGPGCAGLTAFFFEIGPMKFKYGTYIDNVPALEMDVNSWTKVANVIYLDAPTLTGFSYTNTPKVDRSSDTLSASQTAEFIRKFVRDHPKFLENPVYVTGVSYSGIVIPMITEELYKGNDEGLEPIINIKGYAVGNPLTDKNGDINSRLEFVYRVGLISKQLFESTRKDCNGEYVDADPDNLLCMSDIDEVNERVKYINGQQILDRRCDEETDIVNSVNPKRKRFLRANYNPIQMFREQSSLEDIVCRGDLLDYTTHWANDEHVMKALNVRKGTIKEFSQCDNDMLYHHGENSMPLYVFDVSSVVVYHQKLSKRNCRALVFSGDHDMVVPHVGTLDWINSLNLTITASNWDAWYSNDQVAGYKTTYANDNYSLAFVTVKGGGHVAQEYKPKECFDMVKRWFAHKPI